MSSRTRCVVTGATGFLGTNLVAALVADGGWDVRASGMHGSDTSYVSKLGVEVQLANITNADEVDALVDGAEVVFHVAGDTSFWKRNFDRQRAINVDGSLNVARACLRRNVRRMVHTSTMDVLGYDNSGTPISETTGRFNFINMGYNYAETKYDAERQLRVLQGEGLDLVVTYPGFMTGPYDHTLQLGRLFFDLRDGNLPGIPCGANTYCHVGDVAAATMAAAVKGRSGEGYILAGHNMTTADFWQAMADTIGATPPSRVLPEWALVAYAWGAETLSEFTKNEPDLNPGMARYMSKTQFADCTKAIDELGYQISPIESALSDAVEWYRANGHDL